MESAVGSLGLEAGSAEMTTATRQEVLSLYRRIFRLARRWHAASGQMEDTIREKQYIINEARSLFQKNKNNPCSFKHPLRFSQSALCCLFFSLSQPTEYVYPPLEEDELLED
ncbi:LYR motif-containing protein 1 isoform X3 [Trichosurus vulpecula]|uniref:LYR motif-containing protein 1 isoform X3 n=1 Tax=Trichosurus vulpecula TaxID=9337 RepID=UPI00186ACC80|nr:LYR motif-containing protein 1 isoform X3 [Trichosurus vulpecula]